MSPVVLFYWPVHVYTWTLLIFLTAERNVLELYDPQNVTNIAGDPKTGMYRTSLYNGEALTPNLED